MPQTAPLFLGKLRSRLWNGWTWLWFGLIYEGNDAGG